MPGVVESIAAPADSPRFACRPRRGPDTVAGRHPLTVRHTVAGTAPAAATRPSKTTDSLAGPFRDSQSGGEAGESELDRVNALRKPERRPMSTIVGVSGE